MVTYSSVLAWRIPWTEEPGGLQSMGSQSQTWLKWRSSSSSSSMIKFKILFVTYIGNAMLILCYAKSLQSCLTLRHPIDGSQTGSPIPGILQARTLESVAISFSNAWKWKVKVKSFSRVRLLATPWTAAYQAPPSMGFSRQEYWSGVPLPSPKWASFTLSAH